MHFSQATWSGVARKFLKDLMVIFVLEDSYEILLYSVPKMEN